MEIVFSFFQYFYSFSLTTAIFHKNPWFKQVIRAILDFFLYLRAWNSFSQLNSISAVKNLSNPIHYSITLFDSSPLYYLKTTYPHSYSHTLNSNTIRIYSLLLLGHLHCFYGITFSHFSHKKFFSLLDNKLKAMVKK